VYRAGKHSALPRPGQAGLLPRRVFRSHWQAFVPRCAAFPLLGRWAREWLGASLDLAPRSEPPLPQARQALLWAVPRAAGRFRQMQAYWSLPGGLTSGSVLASGLRAKNAFPAPRTRRCRSGAAVLTLAMARRHHHFAKVEPFGSDPVPRSPSIDASTRSPASENATNGSRVDRAYAGHCRGCGWAT
jgi:hypothetical protein